MRPGSIRPGSIRPSVLAAAEALRHELATFEPAQYSGADCAELAEALSLTEKACGAARARAAARAVVCRAQKQRGFVDGVEWVARQAGKSLAEARSELQTAEALAGLPATLQAAMAGELSLAQATEVARAERNAPGSEGSLLELAKVSGLGQLRDAARKRALGAMRAEALYAAQLQARSFRRWRDGLGMICFSGALPPAVGIPIVNRIEAAASRLRRAAGTTAREPFEAYAADALAALLQGGREGGSSRADVVYVVDYDAARRGHLHPGETCHIIDGGPVPVGHVADVAKNAFIKAVLVEGDRIHTVAHFGRHIRAELRTALELGEPPAFEGAACVEAGCGRRYGLEWDHVEPVAHNGLTSYENLAARCKPHHWEKTQRDRQAGLLTPQPP